MTKFAVTKGFQSESFGFVNSVGANVTVIFLARGNLVYPKLRGINSVTKYRFPEGSYVIPKKLLCKNDEAWSKVVKVTDTDIRKTKFGNVGLCFFLFYYIYIYTYIYITINIFA